MAVRHDASESGGSIPHQTVSSGWDPELVPDRFGQTLRPDSACPVEIALAAVAGRWTTLLLRDLMHGPKSYGQLREGLPSLSDKVLAERLRSLVARGLVDREPRRGFPTRTRYSLTDAGARLRPLLVELYRTGQALRRELEPPAAARGSEACTLSQAQPHRE